MDILQVTVCYHNNNTKRKRTVTSPVLIGIIQWDKEYKKQFIN